MVQRPPPEAEDTRCSNKPRSSVKLIMVCEAPQNAPREELSSVCQIIPGVRTLTLNAVGSAFITELNPVVPGHSLLELLDAIEGFGFGKLQQAEQVVVIIIRITFSR